MKYNTIRNDTTRVLNKMHVYIELLERNGYLNINYAPVINDWLAEKFHCEPIQIAQSLMHIGLYDANDHKFNKVKELRNSVWRLAANKDLLKQGMCIPYFPRFTAEEEVIEVRFIECKAARGGRLDVKAICITGHYASGIIKFNLSEGSVQRILRNIGYNNRQYVMPTVYNSLNGLYARLWVKLDNNVLRLKDVVEDSAITQHNRKNMIKYRCGNTTCPRSAGARCSECTATRHECEASYNQEEELL